MAKEPTLAEAARLLSQAASSLINQSSQPSTSRSTESSAVTNQRRQATGRRERGMNFGGFLHRIIKQMRPPLVPFH